MSRQFKIPQEFNPIKSSSYRAMLLLFLLSLFWITDIVSNQAQAAEVITINSLSSCLLCSSKPTQTMYWPSPNAHALLLYIPGGDGFFNLKPGQTGVNATFVNYLTHLANPGLTSGQVSIVLMDTPEPLSPNEMYPSARANEDHMIRIESVVQFYHQKTGLPVWLLGHSAGGISLSHFVEYAQKKNELELINGVVASGVRNETYFNPPISFPILVIHDQEDSCYLTKPIYAKRLFDSLKSQSQQRIELVLIPGSELDGDPCTGGNHMYTGFESLFIEELERFIINQPAPYFLK